MWLWKRSTNRVFKELPPIFSRLYGITVKLLLVYCALFGLSWLFSAAPSAKLSSSYWFLALTVLTPLGFAIIAVFYVVKLRSVKQPLCWECWFDIRGSSSACGECGYSTEESYTRWSKWADRFGGPGWMKCGPLSGSRSIL